MFVFFVYVYFKGEKLYLGTMKTPLGAISFFPFEYEGIVFWHSKLDAQKMLDVMGIDGTIEKAVSIPIGKRKQHLIQE